MKISSTTYKNTPSFKGIYNNKLLLKSLKFAADYPAIFSGTVSLGLSTIVRPLVILTTPKTDKENRNYACAKSLASNAIGYTIMAAATLPVSNAVIKIDKAPQKYISKQTINTLKGNSKELLNSKVYQFATQLFKLGLGFVIAVPKSILTCLLIPPIMTLFFKNTKQEPQRAKQHKNISFKGFYNKATDHIAKGIGKLLNQKPLQKIAERYADTNFAQHIMNATDVLLTGTFIQQTAKSKKIENERKKALIYNSAISTGLSIAGGYAINHYTKNHTEKFIKKFSEINKESPLLEKYLEGIKIAKPVIILGGIYYIAIPIISTFLADKAEKKF